MIVLDKRELPKSSFIWTENVAFWLMIPLTLRFMKSFSTNQPQNYIIFTGDSIRECQREWRFAIYTSLDRQLRKEQVHHTCSVRMEIEAPTATVAWLVEQQIIVTDSQSMLHKIERGMLCIE